MKKPSPAAEVLHGPPLPSVLPKAECPLNPAHVALLKIVAEKIVGDYLREGADDVHMEQAS